MIAAALLSVALMVPAASNIDDGADGWMDYPSVVQKGEKYLPTTVSFYQGPEYRGRWNKCRLQIRGSESSDVYGAMSRSKKYKGAYQMSLAFTVGAGWRIQKSMREQGAPTEQAFQIGEKLRATPAHRWHPFYQEWAFWSIFDNGKGKSHWPHTQGSACSQ